MELDSEGVRIHSPNPSLSDLVAVTSYQLLGRRQVWRVITYQFFFSTASELVRSTLLSTSFESVDADSWDGSDVYLPSV